MVGSIDNDMVGTDMTIGTDSAMHRITEAIDAISSTAESHRRTFIVEARANCGYLALMTAIAGGADYTFLPESPPRDGWEDRMADILARGRAAGRRDSILIVAEGAKDRAGEPITPSGSRTRCASAPERTRGSPSWATCSAAARRRPTTAGWRRRAASRPCARS